MLVCTRYTMVPDNLKAIALEIHRKTAALHQYLQNLGYAPVAGAFFDTITIRFSSEQLKAIRAEAEKSKINFYYTVQDVRISIDETTSNEDLTAVCNVFSTALGKATSPGLNGINAIMIPDALFRKDEYLTHPNR